MILKNKLNSALSCSIRAMEHLKELTTICQYQYLTKMSVDMFLPNSAQFQYLQSNENTNEE